MKTKMFSSVFTFLLITLSTFQSLAADSIVLTWNQATLNGIQAGVLGGTPAFRALALVHTSMYDAWAAYDDNAFGTQRGGTLRRPINERTSSNKNAAISFAAYRTLLRLFGAQTPAGNAYRAQLTLLMVQLGFDANDTGMNTVTPSGIGNLVANDLLNYRQNDGSNQLGNEVGTFWNGTALITVPTTPATPYVDYTGYVPVNPPTPYIGNGTFTVNDPNKWQPLIQPNGVIQTYLTPFWNLVVPFALTSADQFKITEGPARYPSKRYIRDAEESLHINANLTSRQKAIAEYWTDAAGTYTPAGHWNKIAQYVSLRDHMSLDEDVKLFFTLTNAQLDSSISTWYWRRFFDSERPITAIRFLNNGKTIRGWAGPGLGTQEILGQNYRPYTVSSNIPNFPAGHGGVAASSAEILKIFTGSDKYGETVVIPQGSSTIEPGITPSSNVTLHWDTFRDAVHQVGQSNRYAGFHFRIDSTQGERLGKLCAKNAYKKAVTYFKGIPPVVN
jgi:hypothetical protein